LKRVKINQVIYFLNLDFYMRFFLIPKLMLLSKIAMSQIMLPAYQGVVSKIPAVVTPTFSCGLSTVSDLGGNIYNTVLIGTQCWMASNLRVSKYNNGTLIPLDNSGSSTGDGSTETWTARTSGALTVYAHNATNLATYGYLYNWYAATDTRKICPSGWGIPTDAEWLTLTNFIGTNPGTKLKKDSNLWLTNTGTDNYGFSALPGGARYSDGSFRSINDAGAVWSATQSSSTSAYGRALEGLNGDILRSNHGKSGAVSVRCLRD
jgi:uncharacterized protein (TIGR02145 family)